MKLHITGQFISCTSLNRSFLAAIFGAWHTLTDSKTEVHLWAEHLGNYTNRTVSHNTDITQVKHTYFIDNTFKTNERQVS